MAYISSYLLARHRRKRFGFSFQFSDVVSSVAGMEAALIVREEPAAPARLLRSLNARAQDANAPDLDDLPLLLVLNAFLRLRARQGLARAWAEEHPEEARIIKGLRCVLRLTPGIQIVRGALGTVLRTTESDLGSPGINRERLVVLLDRGVAGRVCRDITDCLQQILVPADGHGGWCYLMDVAKAIHAIRVGRIGDDPEATGAIPSGFDDRCGQLRDRIAPMLIGEARRLEAHDLERDIRNDRAADIADGPVIREARVAVAVEMTLRWVGMGDPDLADFGSQREMLISLIPCADGQLVRYEQRTTYLVKRLRTFLKRIPRDLLA